MPRRARQQRLWITIALFAVAALGCFAIVVTAIRTIEAERSERRVVQLTSRTIDLLRDVVIDALEAETGQRGYVLTLDRRYLQPFNSGRDKMGPALRELRKVVAADGNTRELALLDRVEVLTRAKFAEMQRTIDLVEAANVIEAQRLILTDEGQETMGRLRATIAEIEAIEAAQLAAATSHADAVEGRVVPLLGGVIAFLALAVAAGILLITRSARAEAAAAQAPVLAAARDRADLLARELNHRVKNLFAVILAIVKLSLRDFPEARPFAESVVARIQALLKAHEISQGELGAPSVALAELIETTLAPYRSPDLVATLSGPGISLDTRSITPIGLVLHELTTNAIKYGGWSKPGGRIEIAWTEDAGMVVLSWREFGVPGAPAPEPEPERQGFGSQLMTSSARQLGGSIERQFTADGAVVTIRFPAR